MALLKIIKAGDPVLKATAKPVAKVNKHIKKILDDMAETMYAADGVGLAAPQVNESLQLIDVYKRQIKRRRRDWPYDVAATFISERC